MLRILHTADWHLGYVSGQLEERDATKLARARLQVIRQILGLGRRHDVHAVLCAGDLFDTPEPAPEWWRGLLEVLRANANLNCPVLLLPGNHDPLRNGSVYAADHGFRRGLPDSVRVVDRKAFELELGEDAVVLAAPCTSTAGDTDLALSLPNRPPGDTRIRIGLVHGSTFDMPGFETNFPIAKDAADRRGLDYLAIGDTHNFRQVDPLARAPTIYPGAPEPLSFGEIDAGFVALVTFRRSGLPPTVHRERVGRWCWREETVESLPALRSLVEEDLAQTVLRLRLDLAVSIPERDEVDRLLERLRGSIAVHGRAGAMVVDRAHLRLDAMRSALPQDLPDVFRDAEAELRARAATEPVAQEALIALHRLVQELA
jgi:DNA repair exonuclease SbcCD nuclease subunit